MQNLRNLTVMIKATKPKVHFTEKLETTILFFKQEVHRVKAVEVIINSKARR